MTIDRIDAKILEIVQYDNKTTTEVIGAKVGLSPTACQRRLKRLRENGVIERDVSIVSPKAVGHHVAMLVLVTLERERTDIIDRFKQAVRRAPEIMNGCYITGDADFAITVTARNMEEYEQFTRRFFHENPDIKNFKTLVIMDRIKSGFRIPIDVSAGQEAVKDE